MSYRIQVRRNTAALAATSNPVLAAGEPGLETDTDKWKMGNGVTAWNALAYQPSNTSVAAAVAALVNSAPGTLDTLGELATALQAGDGAAAALLATVDLKLDKTEAIATYLSQAAGATKTVSPRDTQRLTQERKPVLLINRTFPNPGCTHRIVWAEGSTLWGYGPDFSLRLSSDGGQSWGKALSNSAASLARWAVDGLFLKTSAGTLLTTSHPNNLAEPKIIRSADGGATWTDVVAAQTNVLYLGSTNLCQDPVTGYLYLSEYVTVNAATQATWKISRSTDDGVTWTTFHTFVRDAVANPTTAVRHGHAVQWDPIGLRIWFACGDSEQAAGLYRVNAGGTDIEAVIVKSQLPADIWAGAVGIMFFPNYIAWGVDQSSDSSLIRMARTQIGQPTPAVEKMGRLQSTAWYTCRVASDNTEWLMFVSNEVSTGRVDAAVHVYRVADDAATLDEVLSIPTPNDVTAISRAYAVGTPLQSAAIEGLVWIGTSITMPLSGGPTLARGQQFSAILGWGGQGLQQTNTDRLPYYAPTTQSSGNVTLTASEKRYFGVTEAPSGATRLYIIDAGREQFSGAGFFYVEVWDVTGAAILKMEDTVTSMQWQNRSRRAVLNEAAAPYLCRSALLSPGRQLRFRLDEVSAAVAEGAAYVTYAWGF